MADSRVALMGPYEAILFDFDGVLVDSEPVHFACWSETLRPLGIDLDWETYRAHGIGLADRDLIEFLAARCRPSAEVEQLWSRYGAKQALFRRRMLESPPYPDTLGGFLKCLANYKLGVVSSSAKSEVEPVLGKLGIRSYFQVLICGEDVSRHKPDPEPYLTAARLLRVSHALVVEDSAAGLAAGRAAGFDVVEVPSADRTVEVVLAALRRPG